MKQKTVGGMLLTALVYGPVLFAVLIFLHLNGEGFSFTKQMMCNLAIGSPVHRILFFVVAWGMAILHIPLLYRWPEIAVSVGGNDKGKALFYVAGVLFVGGFLLFPIFTLNPENMTSYRIHQVVASLYFPACAAIAIVSWVNLRTVNGRQMRYAVASFVWVVPSIVFVVPFIQLAPSAPPYPGWVNLLNWVFLGCYGVWALVYGLSLIGVLDFER